MNDLHPGRIDIETLHNDARTAALAARREDLAKPCPVLVGQPVALHRQHPGRLSGEGLGDGETLIDRHPQRGTIVARLEVLPLVGDGDGVVALGFIGQTRRRSGCEAGPSRLPSRELPNVPECDASSAP